MNLTTKDADTQAEWERLQRDNTDPYGRAVVEVIAKLGHQLDLGYAPAEAEAYAIKGSGITGFQAGAMAHEIGKLHPRGEEFRRDWNTRMGNPEAEGTINPAIVEIS